MAINKVWLCICLAWPILGGTTLYFRDNSVVGPVLWLVAGGIIGRFGPFFLERFIEVIPHRGGVQPPDPIFIAPVVGLIHGSFLGALVGTGADVGSEGQAWKGALLGALLAPPVLSR